MPNPSTVAMDESDRVTDREPEDIGSEEELLQDEEELPADEQRFIAHVRYLQTDLDKSQEFLGDLKEDVKTVSKEVKEKLLALAACIRSWGQAKLPLFESPSPQGGAAAAHLEVVPPPAVSGTPPRSLPQGWRSTLISSLGLPEDIVARLYDADIGTLGGIETFMDDSSFRPSLIPNLDASQIETLERRLRKVPELVESLKSKGIDV